MVGNNITSRPLFQLNTIIWAAMPGPADTENIALLAERGYTIWSLEQRLPAPLTERARIDALPEPTAIEPVADIVLFNEARDRYVLVECKASSFGINASDSPRQARGLITAGGDITHRSLGIAQGTGEVCYVVPHPRQNGQHRTLVACHDQLLNASITACDTSAIGIELRHDGVWLVSSDDAGHETVAASLSPAAIVLPLSSSDEDPTPLYIVPWIPNSDEDDLDVLREKLRSAVLAHTGRAEFGSATLEYDDLLADVSFGVYREWENTQSLKGEVYSVVERIVARFWGNDPRVKVQKTKAIVTIISPEDREALLERVRKARFNRTRAGGFQIPLDTLDD